MAPIKVTKGMRRFHGASLMGSSQKAT